MNKQPELWFSAYHECKGALLKESDASEEEAHAAAFLHALRTWTAAHPIAPVASGHCAVCRLPVAADAVEIGGGGNSVLAHGECWERLRMQRQLDARMALAVCGITEC